MVFVFINCSRFPFIQWIMDRRKIYETRNRNTLKELVGKRVFLVETGKGRSVVRCSAVIGEGLKIESQFVWDCLRYSHRVEKDSVYDWKSETKCKWLYLLKDVQPVSVPFHPPEGIRHGRVWMEVI